MNLNRQLLFLIAAAAVVPLAAAQLAFAQTWAGGGGDSGWSTAGNWQGNTVPVSGTSTIVTFDDPGLDPAPFQDLGAPFTLNQIWIDSTAGAWTFGGQAIRFSGAGSTIGFGGSNLISFSNDWILDSDTVTVAIGSGGILMHGGALGGTGNLTISGSHTLWQTGTISGTGRVYVSGSGAALAIDGSVDASSGGIFLGSFAEGTVVVDCVLRGSGNIDAGIFSHGGRILGDGLTINGDVEADHSAVTVTRFGHSGGSGYDRTQIVLNGQLRFHEGSDAVNGSVSGDISGTGRILVDSNTAISFGEDGGDAILTGVETEIRGSAFGNVTFDGSVWLNGGTLDAGSMVIASREVRTTGSARIINAATTSEFNDVVSVESGSLTVTGTLTGGGSVVAAAGTTLQFGDGSSTIQMEVISSGTITGTAGSRFEGPVRLQGAQLQGPLDLRGDLFIVTPEESLVTNRILSGSIVEVSGQTIIYNAALQVASGALLAGGGVVNVYEAGILDVQGEVACDIVVNDGGTLAGNGTLSGNVEVWGRLAPGNLTGPAEAGDFGLINVPSRIDLLRPSLLVIELGGTAQGITYDAIRGGGPDSRASLGEATLELLLTDDYLPGENDEFRIFDDFGEITGTFGDGSDPGEGSRIYFQGGSFAVDYSGTYVRLFDFQPVPEPGSAWMVCVIPVLLARRRRS